jgi:hypothetical protein
MQSVKNMARKILKNIKSLFPITINFQAVYVRKNRVQIPLNKCWYGSKLVTVLRIRIRSRIRKFLGLPDSDPLVRGMDPDPYPDPCLFS